MDDDTWAAAVADLSRAAEQDGPRRTPLAVRPGRLRRAARRPAGPGVRRAAGPWTRPRCRPAPAATRRADPLPDTVAIEPSRPETWEGAVGRARAVGAGPLLLAEATLRWAYALVASGNALDPAVTRRPR